MVAYHRVQPKGEEITKMFRIYGKHDGLECSAFLGVSESLEEANMLICGHRWGFHYDEVVIVEVS